MEAGKKVKGPKRKFDPLISDSNKEKEKNLKVLDMITSKKPKLDMNKAVGKQLNKEDADRKEEKQRDSSSGRKGGKRHRGGGGGAKGKNSKKADKGNFKNRGSGKNYGKGKTNSGRGGRGGKRR